MRRIEKSAGLKHAYLSEAAPAQEGGPRVFFVVSALLGLPLSCALFAWLLIARCRKNGHSVGMDGDAGWVGSSEEAADLEDERTPLNPSSRPFPYGRLPAH